MRQSRTERKGVSLTEVLIAMFVMSLGMISLLTLFPLGAMQVAQALKDARTAETASQADGFMRTYWRHTVIQNNGDPNLVNTLGTGDSMSDPSTSNGASVASGAITPSPWPLPSSSQSSYPVLLDPIGYLARGTSLEKNWLGYASPVGATQNYLIPRRNLVITPTLTGSPNPIGLCSMMDDITFDLNGLPANAPNISRQGRYTWAALLQRPTNSNVNTASMTILVYDSRSTSFIPTLDEFVVGPNTAIPNPPAAPVRSIDVKLPLRGPGQAPLVRRGGWIMDGTITNATTNIPVRNANFYRITGVTEGAPDAVGNVVYNLDLDNPLVIPPGLTANPYPAQFYLFANLSEVFVRPLLQPDPK